MGVKVLKSIIRTNNIVTLSFAEAVLKEAGIQSFIMDQHMSLLEGSIGAIPRRLMVVDDDVFAAQRALRLAGLAEELEDPDKA